VVAIRVGLAEVTAAAVGAETARGGAGLGWGGAGGDAGTGTRVGPASAGSGARRLTIGAANVDRAPEIVTPPVPPDTRCRDEPLTRSLSAVRLWARGPGGAEIAGVAWIAAAALMALVVGRAVGAG
jgi:hypothetical protein